MESREFIVYSNIACYYDGFLTIDNFDTFVVYENKSWIIQPLTIWFQIKGWRNVYIYIALPDGKGLDITILSLAL